MHREPRSAISPPLAPNLAGWRLSPSSSLTPPSRQSWARIAWLLCFETLGRELKCPGILGDGAHHMIRHTAGNVCIDLEGHIHLCTNQPGQMGDYLVRNTASIPANTSWFKDYSPVESPGLSCLHGCRGAAWRGPHRSSCFVDDSCSRTFSRRGRSIGLLLLQRPFWAHEKTDGRIICEGNPLPTA